MSPIPSVVSYLVTTDIDKGVKETIKLGFPERVLKDILEEEEIPDVYFERGVLLLDLNFLDERTMVAIGKDRVVVFADGETQLLRKIRNAVRKRRKFLQNREKFVSKVISAQLDIVYDHISEVHKFITRMERVLYRNLSADNIALVLDAYHKLMDLLDVRRELSYFLRVLISLKKVPYIHPETIEELRSHIHEVLSFVNLTISSTKSILDLHDKAMSTQLNILVKRLTSISIILSVITIITGIYGMNFKYLPLATHPHGFWILNGIMVAVFIILAVILKKINYL